MIGVALLLLFGVALALVIASFGVAWEALHPPRRTTAWALARGTNPDPAPLGRPWRTLRHTLADGRSFEAWEIDGAETNGPLVVIVHGWSRSRWDSLRRVEPFIARASRIVLPDLRGHGDAEGRTALGTCEHADLVELLQRLDAGANGRAVVLVGHSMGAGVIIRAACEVEPPPSSLVAIAPYRRVSTPISARLLRKALPARLLVPPAMIVLRLCGIRDDDLLGAASRLRSPLLVVSSEFDAMSPSADGRDIAGSVPNDRGRFVGFAGADHADPGAGEPDRFKAELLRALGAGAAERSPTS